MTVPSWLKCGNCLWWPFDKEIIFYHAITREEQSVAGCIHPDIVPQIHSCDYRCPRWVCRRCLTTLDDILATTPEIENHNKCKKVGRGSKNKENCGFLNNGESNE